MRTRIFTIVLLTAAVALPTLSASAGDVSVGIGVNFGHHWGHRRYYRAWPRYYYRPFFCPPPVVVYEPAPVVYYPPLPPRAPFANYDDPNPDGWPRESTSNLKDHGALISARGWTYLAHDDFRAAADAFTDNIDDHPALGLPRIGYAITAARYGDLLTGTKAMREALTYDPEALNRVPRNYLLDPKVENVLDRYKVAYERSENQADPAFMIASLEYILGHKTKAVKMVDTAMKQGDDSAAIQNLRALLDARPSAQVIKADPDLSK